MRENEIAGGDAEKENVIKVFKDNGLENCLVGMILVQMSLKSVGSLALSNSEYDYSLSTSEKELIFFLSIQRRWPMFMLLVVLMLNQQRFLFSSIQAFDLKTQTLFQILEEQQQQEWVQFSQQLQRHLDHLPSNTTLQSWEDQQLNESLLIM